MSSINMPSPPVIPKDAALGVVKGSIGCALAATAFGSMYGVMKAQPATFYAFQTGANTFVFAFPFFALREYVVSPLLTTNTGEPSIHTDKLGSSAISGAVVGGAMSAYFRGPQKLLSGSSTFGILATSLQLVGNEMRVLKVRYLAEENDRPDVEVGSGGTTAAPTTSSLRKAVNTTAEATAAALPASLSPPPTSDQTASDTSTTTTPQSAPWLQRVTSYITSLSPVTKLSDEEYAEQLRDRRKQVLERMAAIEETIAQESRAEKQV